MSRYLIDELERRERVELLTHREVVELKGEDALEAIVVARQPDRRARRARGEGAVRVHRRRPHTDWLRGHVAMDEHGFLFAGRDLQDDQLAAYGDERPFFLETSLPGIFAVGDVRSGSIKRVASAVGEGSMAVRLVYQRLAAAESPRPAISAAPMAANDLRGG